MRRTKTVVASLCIIALLLPINVFGQTNKLSVDWIMKGPELVGNPPAGVYWSRDSQKVYFRWKKANEPRLKAPDLYLVNRDGSGLKKLSEEEARLAPPDSGELSRDKRFTVFAEDGDIFVYDHSKGERKQVTSTTDAENNPHFTTDQQHIYFTRQNNLYTVSMDGATVQLTDIRQGPPGEDRRRGTESQEWVKKENRDLLDAVRERAQNREELDAKRKQKEKRKPFNVPPGQNVFSLNLSPDGKFVVATVGEQPRDTRNTIVPNYVTESGYTEDIPGRNKVGDTQNRTRLVFINTETGETRNLDHGIKDPRDKSEKPKDRELSLSPLRWSEDGTRAVAIARSADNKDRFILSVDASSGKARVLDTLHDEAWINGFGRDPLGFLPDNHTIYFQSERDGYSHLYIQDTNGGPAQQLTKGEFEVSETQLSEDRTKFIFASSEGSPFEHHFYSMNFDGSARTRLTSRVGHNEVRLSPDGTMQAVIYSSSNRPPELFLQANQPGAEWKQITYSPTDEFLKYPWIEPPIVKFKARDGVEVPGRLYKPKDYKGGAAVIFVHGAGYLQNVHKWWSQYYREYMFHHLLMEKGFLVYDIDYRGSAGYGRDWRTAIYRHMGGKDLTDHVDAAKFLAAEHGVDPKRIGIYGGSYGGFITLMAMFTEPDAFAAGAALRPVTDWAHYNHGYTSNILNNPQNDAEAYKQSSPIYFAQGLKGALLICHGMVDVNVHFQDTVRLVEKLIELRKENWELAAYPVEDHGFERPTSWADEYKRILKLFTVNLQPEQAPAAVKPASKKK